MSGVVRLVALLVATGSVVIGCWAVLRRIEGLRASQRALLALVAVPSVITVLVLLLGGVVRTLNPLTLLISAVGFGWFAVRRSGPPPWQWDRRLVRRNVNVLLRCGLDHPLISVVVVVALARVALQVVWAVAIPMWSWDSLQYHLPEPSAWVQTGHLGRGGYTPWGDGYPMGQEVLHAWTMTLLHTIRGTGLVVLWLVALGAAATYRLARAFRAVRALSVMAAAIFVSIPVVVLQVGTAYVDAGAAAAALGALALGLDAADARRTNDQARAALLIGSAASAGLAISMKPSMAPVAIAWFACALGTESLITPLRTSPALVRRRWALSLGALVVLGATWYLVNVVSHGNPLYPVRLLGLSGEGSYEELVLNTQAPEAIRSASTLVQIWRSWSTDLDLHDLTYDQRLGGLGAVWVLVALPCLVAFAWLSWAKERRQLLIVGLTALATVAITRSIWWSRYSLVLAGVGCVAIAVVADRLARGDDAGRKLRARPGAALAVVGLVVLTVLPVAYRSASSTAIQGVDPDGASTTFGLRDAGRLIADRDTEARVWPWFASPDLQALPEGSTIAYLSNGVVLPQVLIGLDLQHRVERIAPQPTPEALQARLAELEADYLFLPVPPRAGSVEAIAMTDQHLARRVTGEAIGGGALWELGSFEVCDTERTEASAERDEDAEAVAVEGELRDGCGPVDEALVEVWVADRSGTVWSSARRVDQGTTDEDGRFEIEVDAEALPKGARWFVRFTGRSDGEVARPPLASAPRTLR